MNLLVSIKDFMLKCGRVWQVIKKPSKEEFKIIAKVSALGVLLIGLIGFIISVIMTVLNFK
jgi:protein transport protein SEC61 subunit gamma-like protein